LRLLAKTVSKDLELRFVTPETEESAVLEKPKQSARGWYVSSGSSEAVYVLSPEFKNSVYCGDAAARVDSRCAGAHRGQPERRRQGIGGGARQTPRIAAAYAKEQGLTGFESALGDVQEFISWGMTNQEFQRNVLAKVSMESKTKGNALVDGMKAFIERVVGLLFKGSSKTDAEVAVNGMTSLISNVSGLFAAKAAAPKTGGSINLSMATNPSARSSRTPRWICTTH